MNLELKWDIVGTVVVTGSAMIWFVRNTVQQGNSALKDTFMNLLKEDYVSKEVYEARHAAITSELSQGNLLKAEIADKMTLLVTQMGSNHSANREEIILLKERLSNLEKQRGPHRG